MIYPKLLNRLIAAIESFVQKDAQKFKASVDAERERVHTEIYGVYRLLNTGEVIEEGDQYKSLVTGKWHVAKSIGGTVPSSLNYRRRIERKAIISTGFYKK